ncbi:hypothetical protein [Pontibacter rugosus]
MMVLDITSQLPERAMRLNCVFWVSAGAVKLASGPLYTSTKSPEGLLLYQVYV